VSSAPEFASYTFDGRDELCLKVGGAHQKHILLIPPLFDEMNRMRRMLVDVMRHLDAHQIGSILPDLPGTNESLLPQDKASLGIWTKALTNCASQHDCSDHIASFRGGSLIDGIIGANQHWRLTPAKGSTLLRTMMRTRIASDKESGVSLTMAKLAERAQSETILLAGNSISPAMFTALQDALPTEPEALRTARLESDSQKADIKLPGSALWLRAEPDADTVLSSAIADDLASWVHQ